MLEHLAIRNFAIIEDLSLELGPGLTVLTGETGAGKSIIIDAVHLLIGERAESGMVRTEAEAALVEGVFAFPDGPDAGLAAVLAAHDLELEDGRLILSRELRSEGRNVCRANGRIVPLKAVQEIAQGLVDIHGQGEHLSLLRPREHIEYLDGFAGLLAQRAEHASVVRELRSVQRELAGLRADERERARRIDLLAYQCREIEAAKLRPGEAEELEEESRLLASSEERAARAEEAYQALKGELGRQDAALDLLGAAAGGLAALARLDPSWAERASEMEGLADALEEAARGLRDYRDEIDFSPQRLQEVQERLHLIRDLRRKYGESIEEILAFGARVEADLADISNAEGRISELERREEEGLREVGGLAEALSAARQGAAPALAGGVEVELDQLSMSGARFAVDLRRRAPGIEGLEVGGECCGFDETGIDQVEFLVAPNVGEPLKPLARVASGGEASRLMLALKGTLSSADRTPTLIFDEIDVGIGGRVGSVVGRKLRRLAEKHQVLCVTHLPQIASFADSHYRIRKEVAGARTVVLADRLEEERVQELAQMMGSTDESSKQTAREMLRRAEEEK